MKLSRMMIVVLALVSAGQAVAGSEPFGPIAEDAGIGVGNGGGGDSGGTSPAGGEETDGSSGGDERDSGES